MLTLWRAAKSGGVSLSSSPPREDLTDLPLFETLGTCWTHLALPPNGKMQSHGNKNDLT